MDFSERSYHHLAAPAAPSPASSASPADILAFRGTSVRRVRATTSPGDVVVFVLPAVLILLGDGAGASS